MSTEAKYINHWRTYQLNIPLTIVEQNNLGLLELWGNALAKGIKVLLLAHCLHVHLSVLWVPSFDVRI